MTFYLDSIERCNKYYVYYSFSFYFWTTPYNRIYKQFILIVFIAYYIAV